jgi:hypothetical protein
VALIVVSGTGGMGREALAGLADTHRGDDDIGFLDDAPATQAATATGLPVIGPIDLLTGALRPDHDQPPSVVVAIGDPSARPQVINRSLIATVALANRRPPDRNGGPRTSVGPGSTLCPLMVLTCDVTVGRGAIVHWRLWSVDSTIREAPFVAPGAHIAGSVTIGFSWWSGSARAGIPGGHDR